MIKRSIASLLLIVVCWLPLVAQGEGREAAWRADIDYMMRRLEIQHPNLYGFVTRENFHAAADLLKLQIPTLTDPQMLYAVMELLSLVSDDHTGIWYPECPAFAALKMAPVGLYPFADGMHVAYAAPEHAAIVGKKVIRIGTVSADEALARVVRLANGDSLRQKEEIARILLSIPGALAFCGIIADEATLPLVVEDAAGKRTSVNIAAEPVARSFPWIAQGPFPGASAGIRLMNGNDSGTHALWLRNPDANYWFAYLAEKKTMYLRLKAMRPHKDEDFSAFYERFFRELDGHEVEKLIIDLRNNPGGSQYEMPLLKGVIARRALDAPERLFVIINRGVGSAAQQCANVFAKYTRATFIGEPTGTRPNFFGSMRTFTLPNHPQILIGHSTLVFQEAGSDNFDLSLAPAVHAPLRAGDFQSHRDPAMERIDQIAAINAGKVALAEQLTRAYAAGGFAALRQAWDTGKQRLLAVGVDLEQFLDDFARNWLHANKKSEEDYTGFLSLARAECPRSIGFCFRLGARLQHFGQVEKACALYRACLEMHPGHLLAQSRLNLIALEQEFSGSD